jgi:anti-anti-sigma regulatory factor
MSTLPLSDPLSGTSLVELSIHRLGERTCVINVGTELRHVELPLVEEAVEGVMRDAVRDLVFDLTFLRRYETFALVRLAREWDRLAASGCAVHVAAREARVVADLERLVSSVGWQLHPSTTRALRALLSAPLD